MSEAVNALEELSEDAEARRMAEDRASSQKFYQLGLARSEARGREAGLQEGREAGLQEGREAGLQEGQRAAQLDSIRLLCESYGIELTESREQELSNQGTDLRALMRTLVETRQWPE